MLQITNEEVLAPFGGKIEFSCRKCWWGEIDCSTGLLKGFIGWI